MNKRAPADFPTITLSAGDRAFALRHYGREKKTETFFGARMHDRDDTLRFGQFDVQKIFVHDRGWVMTDTWPVPPEAMETLAGTDNDAILLEHAPRLSMGSEKDLPMTFSGSGELSKLINKQRAEDIGLEKLEKIWLVRIGVMGFTFDVYQFMSSPISYIWNAVSESVETYPPVRSKGWVKDNLAWLPLPGKVQDTTMGGLSPLCPHCQASGPHINNGAMWEEREYKCNTCYETFTADEAKGTSSALPVGLIGRIIIDTDGGIILQTTSFARDYTQQPKELATAISDLLKNKGATRGWGDNQPSLLNVKPESKDLAVELEDNPKLSEIKRALSELSVYANSKQKAVVTLLRKLLKS